MQRHSRTLTPASPVHYYSALYSGSWTAATSASSPYVITGLTPSITCQVQVTAVNAQGSGSYSSSRPASTSATPPTAVPRPAAVPVVGQKPPLPGGWEFPDPDGHFFHGTTLWMLISSGLAFAPGAAFRNPYAGFIGLLAPMVVAIAIGEASPVLIFVLVVVAVGGAATFIFLRR